MAQQDFREIRVFYTRGGAAKFISHLEVNRCMQRALARSKLPIWYTQGFNPHIYITFALPTPLGYESDCETMDMRVIGDIPCEEIERKLNESLPEGLQVYRVAPPQHKPDDIAWADYRVLVSLEDLPPKELRVKLEDFLAQDSIPAVKQTKKGKKEIDLKPFLTLLSLQEEGEGVSMQLRLPAGAANNINPTLVVNTFCSYVDGQMEDLRIRKLAIYTDNPVRDEIFV